MADDKSIMSFSVGTVKDTDYYPAVDTTDHTQSSEGSTKRYLMADLEAFLFSFMFANPVAPAIGGTGIDNGSSTITLGGSFAMSGAHTFTGTVSATTAVTFPTSGTLATTSQLLTTPISGTLGGTGVNNGASTITIGGAFAMSGAHSFTGTITADTTITYPTTGTLATTSQIPTVLTWSEVTTTTQTMSVSKGYIANNASIVTFTLPVTSAVGDVMRVVGKGAGGWGIIQNSGQQIRFGSVATTTTTGSLASSNAFDCVHLVCTTASTIWTVMSSQGSLSTDIL